MSTENYPKRLTFVYTGPVQTTSTTVLSEEEEAEVIENFAAGKWSLIEEKDPAREYFDILRKLTGPDNKRMLRTIEDAERALGIER